MSNAIQKYGYEWPSHLSDLDIELAMLRKDLHRDNPLPHYLAIDKILWPEDDQHRWFKQAFDAFSRESIVVLMGASDSGKTFPAAKWGLIEYWVRPEETLVLVSSTDVRGLELRVWGAIKELFNRALNVAPNLPGVVLEAKHAITTEEVRDQRRARTLRKGIICIPCLQGGKYVGLGKYIGVKQKRLRQIADECQLMGASFLDAVPNFIGKDYKGTFLGNPLDPMDPLGRVAEPIHGWGSHGEPKKTTTWRTKLYNGICVNFVGTDSPNFDHPRDKPPRYPYMISWKKIDAVCAFWGPESIQYFSQCVGVMKVGLVGNRVITTQLCNEHNAEKEAVWKDTNITDIYAIDPAYGGEDRCVGGRIQFGLGVHGRHILKVYPPRVYPIRPGISKKPERQIAEELQKDLLLHNIPSTSAFYDSFGKGTIGAAFAEVFGKDPPVPVDAGGPPSDRPVRHDLFIYDKGLGYKRLKRCDEHYSKFITEMWFSARYVIECDQMCELPMDVRDEGCLREYGVVQGNKFQLEKKEDTRERMGRSPDLFDWLAVAIEGARQLGFEIKSGTELTEVQFEEEDDLAQEQQWLQDKLKSCLLQH